MPVRPLLRARYPEEWDETSRRISFERAQNRCEWYRALNYQLHPATGSRAVLTGTHVDSDPTKNDDRILAPLCQRCQNWYDGGKRASVR